MAHAGAIEDAISPDRIIPASRSMLPGELAKRSFVWASALEALLVDVSAQLELSVPESAADWHLDVKDYNYWRTGY